MKKIAIAGASGFVGRHLIAELIKNDPELEIRALSRKSNTDDNCQQVKWIKADLFSVLDIEKALEGCDLAFYLVHSMNPSAHLDQASFEDYDLILADNFGRACAKKGIKQVFYLGGLVSRNEILSAHLKSRIEVEQTLSQYVEQTTIFRSALILGHGGSSFHILMNLLIRAPILICPWWTQLPTGPVSIQQVCKAMTISLNDKSYWGKSYDLGSSNQLSYLEILKLSAKYLGLKRYFIMTRFTFARAAMIAVKLVSGAPKNLVYPLVLSLKNKMVPDAQAQFKHPNYQLETVETSLKQAIRETVAKPHRFDARPPQRKTVRSVQRMLLPDQMNAKHAAIEYMAWLPWALRPFIGVKVQKHDVFFYLFSLKFTLLHLVWSPERSEDDRQLFYIKGGMLAARQERGRLEFREALKKKYMLAAIHDFAPALPWYAYICSQAIIHLIVMKLFRRHLKLIAEGKRSWLQKNQHNLKF